jgi:hypothetical protein
MKIKQLRPAMREEFDGMDGTKQALDPNGGAIAEVVVRTQREFEDLRKLVDLYNAGVLK